MPKNKPNANRLSFRPDPGFKVGEFVMTETGADGPGPALVVRQEGEGRYTVNFPSGVTTENFPGYDMRYPTHDEWRHVFISEPPAYVR